MPQSKSAHYFINIHVFVGVSVVTLDVLLFCLPPWFDVFIASLVLVKLAESEKDLIKGGISPLRTVSERCYMSLIYIT